MSDDEEILGIGPRLMVELGSYDCKVIRVALSFITDDSVDNLIRRTKIACPDEDPGAVETNCLLAYMTAKDLYATMTELITTTFEGNHDGDRPV